MNNFSDNLETFFSPKADGIIPVPILVKGQLIYPPEIPTTRVREMFTRMAASQGPGATHVLSGDGVQIIRQPIFDRRTFEATAKYQYLVLPCVSPHQLIEKNHKQLATELYNLPFREFLEYVALLRNVFETNKKLIEQAAAMTNNATPLDDRMVNIIFEQIPFLLDSQALANAVDRELGGPEGPGHNYLDNWLEVDAFCHRGITARMRDSIFSNQIPHSKNAFIPRLRAIPTRQLHITAGNAPILPFLSFLRGLATKSALVIKSPAEVVTISALLSIGIWAAAPQHPITRHISLVYWKGGERRMEDVLFTPEAFDRLVVWGSPKTVASVRTRANNVKTVFLNPRYGLSFIGKQAFDSHQIQEVASRACSDSMVANQRACTSSLVHYLEADEKQALDYCRALHSILAVWDQKFPHAIPRATIGKLRMLRRREFFNGVWFENGKNLDITSAVVYMPEPFDISVHPMCRCIVVRRLDYVDEILEYLNSSVSTIGVFPEPLRYSLCDPIAAMGVSNILPLGECEQVYAGMPHDGMRMLSELVNWTNA